MTAPLTRPIPGDPLALSNGKPSTVIVDAIADIVDEHEATLAGPLFKNTNEGVAVPSWDVLVDTTTATGWFAHNASSAPAVSTTVLFPGTKSVTATLNVGSWLSPAATADFGYNFPVPVTVGTRSHLALFLRYDNVGSGDPTTQQPERIMQIVVASGANFTGQVVAFPLARGHSTAVFTHWLLPVHSFTTVGSVGIRQWQTTGRDAETKQQKWYVNQIMWAPQTELQAAQAGTAEKGIIVPGNYTPTAFDAIPGGGDPTGVGTWVRDVGFPNSVLDLRPGHETLSNRDGIKTARQFGLDETMSRQNSIDLFEVLRTLSPGDTFQFSANGRYLMYSFNAPRIANLHDVTIDGQGCQLIYEDVVEHNALAIQDCSNLTLKNFKILGIYPTLANGDQMTTYAGTPTTDSVAHTKTLVTEGDALSRPAGAFHRDEDGLISFDITASQTGTTEADLFLELRDEAAPPAPSGLTQISTEGPIVGSTTSNITYYYRTSYVDVEGRESGMSDPRSIRITSAWGRVGMTVPVWSGTEGPPIASRRIYRTKTYRQEPFNATNKGQSVYDADSYVLVGVLNDNTTTTFRDSTPIGGGPQGAATFTVADAGAGNIESGGVRVYWVTTVDSAGREGHMTLGTSNQAKVVTTTGKVNLAGLPTTGLARRIYRSLASTVYTPGATRYAGLVAEQRSTDPGWAAGTYTDNSSDATLGIINNRRALDMLPYLQGTTTNELYYPCTAPSYTAQINLTAGSTPTTYRVTIPPKGEDFLDSMFTPILRKQHQATNAVTIHTYSERTRRPAYDDTRAIEIWERCRNVVIDNVTVEGFLGDHTGLRGDDSRGTIIRNCRAIQVGRQAFSVSNGSDVLFENCEIIAPGRSGFDMEPVGNDIAYGRRITFKDCTFRAVTNNDVNFSTTADGIVFEDCDFYATRGIGLHNISITGGHVRMKNIHAPWKRITVTGARNVEMDGITSESLSVLPSVTTDVTAQVWGSEGGYVRDIHLNGLYSRNTPLVVTAPNVLVSDVTLNQVSASFLTPFTDGMQPVETSTVRNGPFNVSYPPSVWTREQSGQLEGSVAGQNNALMMDPGMWTKRFPSTFKGVHPGKLHFPRGLDMLSESALAVRGISSTSVRSNNLSGTAAITAGVTTATVVFPTRAYESLVLFGFVAVNRPAGGGVYWSPAGTLTAGTYYYRVGGRSMYGGPASWSSEFSFTLAAPNNAIKVNVSGIWGTTTYIDGITVLRGTASGVYTTRYDILPTADEHAFAELTSNNTTPILDLGTQVATATGIVGDPAFAYGYDRLYSPTATTEYIGSTALSGSNWLAVNQSGYEPDRSYRSFPVASWPTSVSVTAKRVDGFDLSFGVACPTGPTGGGTVDWMVIR